MKGVPIPFVGNPWKRHLFPPFKFLAFPNSPSSLAVFSSAVAAAAAAFDSLAGRGVPRRRAGRQARFPAASPVAHWPRTGDLGGKGRKEGSVCQFLCNRSYTKKSSNQDSSLHAGSDRVEICSSPSQKCVHRHH